MQQNLAEVFDGDARFGKAPAVDNSQHGTGLREKMRGGFEEDVELCGSSQLRQRTTGPFTI